MARNTVSTDKKNAEVEVNSAKINMIDDLIKGLNKEFASDTGTLISRLGDKPMEVETISTGSVVLDSILGGGFPKGRLIEVYGPEASGKTSIALTAVGNVQKNGGMAAFVDLENALDPKYARKLGVDTKNLYVSQPDYAEQALNLVFKLTQSGLFDIIVVDSIASMVPKAELEADMEQQTIGLLARILSKGLKQLISYASRTGTTVVFINQIREAVGTFSPYGTPTTTPGGKAMKFFASQRIDVRRMGQVKDGSKIIGNEVKLKVVKNKIAPPFGESTTVLSFNKGINRAAEVIEVGPTLGVIDKPNNRTYRSITDPELVYGTSKAAAVEYFEKHPDELEKVSAILKEKLAKGLEDLDDEVVEEELLEEDLENEEDPLNLESEGE